MRFCHGAPLSIIALNPPTLLFPLKKGGERNDDFAIFLSLVVLEGLSGSFLARSLAFVYYAFVEWLVDCIYKWYGSNLLCG